MWAYLPFAQVMSFFYCILWSQKFHNYRKRYYFLLSKPQVKTFLHNMYSRISNTLVGSAMKGGRDFTLALLYLLSHSLSLSLSLSFSLFHTVKRLTKHSNTGVVLLKSYKILKWILPRFKGKTKGKTLNRHQEHQEVTLRDVRAE